MRVALDTDRVSIVEGDTLEVLRTFASKSVDIILTDPPYNEHVHANLGKERRNDGHKAREALRFPPMTPAQIVLVMAELVRVCRGWILVFSDFYNSHHWGESAQSAGGAWVRTGQWLKTSPMPQMTGDRPATAGEDIVICHASSDTAVWDWNGKGHAALWRGKRDQAYGGEDAHPNQKPLWLLQSLLGMFAPANATCLDPYFGSGSLAIAALSSERFEGESPAETTCPKCAKKILELYQPPLPQNINVIGVEGDPKYTDLAIARIREAAPALMAA